jgi:DNA repair protein RadC
MAASQFDSVADRHRSTSAILASGAAVKRAVADLFGGLANRDGDDPPSQPVRSEAGSGRLRNWSGVLGLPSICDDFWSDALRAGTSEQSLLADAMGKKQLSASERLLFDQLGSLPRILLASRRELSRISGDDALSERLAAIRDVALRFLASDEIKPELSDSHTLIRYLCAQMGHLRTETFKAIFLDGYNRVIAAETLWHGTVSEVHIHPREVMRRAIELDASAIIVAHNHPSGTLKPSGADIRLTKKLLSASAAIGLTLHDHLIVSATGATSMRVDRHIEPWP